MATHRNVTSGRSAHDSQRPDVSPALAAPHRLNLIDPRQLHSLLRLRIRHEPPPYTAVTKILDAQKSHSDIESQSIGRYPSGTGVEGVGQPIFAPNLVAVLVLHGVHCGNAYIWSEHQRASGRARHHAPVHFRMHWRAAPCLITVGTGR